jgi:uncharacterized repeat protein (TIGR01451 family)
MTLQLNGPCGLTHSVDVLAATPAIAVEKSPDVQGVGAGNSAVFTVTVTNTGNVDLTGVEVEDTVAPDCARAVGVIPVNGSEIYTCSRPNIVNNFTNLVTARGFASINGTPMGDEVNANDSAQVFVASFVLSKTVYVDGYFDLTHDGDFNSSPCALKSSLTVPSGTTVKYCYTITNTGDYTLSTHSLVDSHFPAAILSSFPRQVGPGTTFSNLDAGLQVTKTMTVSTTNIATWTAEIAAPIVSLEANAVNASIPVVGNAQATVTISSNDLDQDDDGISDFVEGSGDLNNNGIPDFLDPADPTAEPPTNQPMRPGELFIPSLGKGN